MRRVLQRLDAAVALVEKVVIFTVFMALVVVLFVQVLSRFVLQSPLDFTEELSRVLLVWLVFVGAARGVATVEHFVVDFLVEMFPPPVARAIGYAVDAVCVAFLLAVAWVSLRTALGASTQILPAMQVPILVQTLAMPVGFVLMLWHALVLVAGGWHVTETKAVAQRAEELVEGQHEEAGS